MYPRLIQTHRVTKDDRDPPTTSSSRVQELQMCTAILVCVVLEVEPRGLYILGQHSAI